MGNPSIFPGFQVLAILPKAFFFHFFESYGDVRLGPNKVVGRAIGKDAAGFIVQGR
jgi:hypothetical protein